MTDRDGKIRMKSLLSNSKITIRLKNYLKVNPLFWKFRHIVDRRVWNSYLSDYNSERRQFYARFAQSNDVRCVFEFGSASGPNLKNIQANFSENVKVFGYDLSAAAIREAKKHFSPKNSYFTQKLNISDLDLQLNLWGVRCFDLAIFDRVLYLMSEEEVRATFSTYKKYFSKVVIDDFHSSDGTKSNGVYYSKDYVRILTGLNYKLISEDFSEHLKSEAFFKKTAKRLLFDTGQWHH